MDIISGILCAIIAECNGRNIILAAISGCIFGFLAIIAYIIIGEKTHVDD